MWPSSTSASTLEAPAAAARSPFVLRLDEIGPADLPQVGSKAAHLGRLIGLGMPVPDGFCVTDAALRCFLEANGAADASALRDEEAERLRELILRRPLPAEVEDEVVAAYRRLALPQPSGAVAVRSSGRAEDLADSSFAGVYETFLGIAGVDQLLRHVRRCWASLWSPTAAAYRRSRAAGDLPAGGGVIVQRMLAPRAAGVAFTANPLTGGTTEVVIEAVPGLGEELVSGRATPERWVVAKRDRRIVERTAAGDPSGDPVLAEAQVLALAARALEIERRLGRAQDVEWALEGSDLFFLQTRPVTTLPPAYRGSGADWTRAKIQERFPTPLKPLEASFLSACIFDPAFEKLLTSLGLERGRGGEVFAVFGGLAHLNGRVLKEALRGVPEPLAREIVEGEPAAGRPGMPLSLPLLGTALRLLRLILRRHRETAGDVARYLARYRAFHRRDFSRLTLAALGREIAGILTTIREIGAGHMQSIAVAELLFTALQQVARDAAGERGADLVCALTRGLAANKSVELGERFGALVETARRTPRAAEILLSLPPREALATVRRDVAALPFLRGFQDLLEDFGHRTAEYPLSHPRWREEPEQVIAMIADALAAGPGPAAGGEVPADGHGEALRPVRAGLRRGLFGRWLPVRPLAFAFLVRYARIYCGVLRENEGYYITQPFPDLKRALHAASVRLVERAVLAQPEDVYFLTLPELGRLLAGEAPPRDLAERIGARRADHVAAGPAAVPPAASSEIAATTRRLAGTAVSPGRAQGRACVLAAPGEALDRDAILVTHTLNPAWVPLLRRARGVVTEVGGMLSHGAVVAREFGVPAVMGVPGATRRIRSGQALEVDGYQGAVIFTEEESS